MVFQLMSYILFFTISFSSFYSTSAEDIKEIKFAISSKWNYSQSVYDNKCVGDESYDIKVGDQFQVYVTYGEYNVQNIGRCLMSQASDDFVVTSFRDVTYPGSFISVRYVTVTIPGEWNYECVFYFRKCTFKDNKCFYNGWSGKYEDVGVRCSTKLLVKKVIEPSGYLTANGVHFSPNDTEHIYKFREGENIEFICHKTTGNWAKLLYPTISGKKNSTAPIWGASVSISLELSAPYNYSTVDCIIHGDRSRELIKVRLILDEDSRGGVWIGVAVVVLIALLLAAGLGMTIRHRKKKRLLKNIRNLDKNSPVVVYQKQPTAPPSQAERPDEVTYAEPYCIHNIYTKDTNTHRNNLDDHTYLNSEQLNNMQSALVQKSEPGYALVDNSEPTYASVHNIEPNFTSKKNSELNFASVKNSVQNSIEAILNQNSTEYQNVNNIKRKDDNKKSAKVAKKGKKSDKPKGLKKSSEHKKTNQVTYYADLNHSNMNVGNFSSPKVPVHSVKGVNDEYENADVNNDIEPAYCEIIPTKK